MTAIKKKVNQLIKIFSATAV